MEKSIKGRFLWAVEMLEVDPSDCILEIGCGHGAAIFLICKSLIGGTITAIDRSDKMIQMAKKMNASHIASGKANLIAAPLHEAELGQRMFNKIFALNVNLFWMKATRELEIVKERLLPGGTFYLFNQPPVASKVAYIAESTSKNLVDAGFTVLSVVREDQAQVPWVCVIATHNQSDRIDRSEF